MRSHLEIKDMREVAQLRGGKCLSNEYINQFASLKWMCAKGHTWDTGYKIVQQGGWCVQCIREEIKQERLENLYRFAKKKGGKCLSSVYFDNKTNLKWQCHKKHTWEARPNNILSGQWCPRCKYIHLGEQLKTDINDIRKIAETRGGKLLSKEYVNNRTPLKFQCSKQHIWKTTADSLKAGHWCPYCSHTVKLTIKEMHLLAKQKNGKCLSSRYINVHSKLKWECSKGHTWKATPHDIKDGHWCPHCTHKARLTIEEMQSIAKKRNGKCLSSKYVNATTKLKWQCHKKHTWIAVPYSIKVGQWCPECANEKKSKLAKAFYKN